MVGRVDFGVETPGAADVPELLDTAKKQWQANFCVVPLAHPRYWRDHRQPRQEQFTRSDLVLDSESWSGHVVGKISPWLQLDSADPTCRRQSEAAFKQEVAWASHLTLHSILVPPPGAEAVNYARCIIQALLTAPHVHIWVRVPLTHPSKGDQAATAPPAEEEGAEAAPGLDEEPSSGSGAWGSWNRLRCLCEQVPNLGVALQFTADLPDDPDELARWCGEPVRAVILPASIFLTNRQGYPTLSRRHQAALQQLMPHRPRLVVSGRPDAHGEGLGAHVQYLRFLASKLSTLTQQEKYEAPYYDFLQAPLQPLQDNLESQTYETFEKDPVKYERYERAIHLYLMHQHAPGAEAVVMVVGAGRGPLVAAALAASRSSGRRVRVFAVEKNPNAVVTLRGRCRRDEGWAAVTVVPGDMREWEAPVMADVLVSELLGSWGDNELSPECLDGAQRYLKPGGASIPQDYTSFVAPISSARLWNEVKHFKDLSHFETHYVVKVHNAYCMCPSKECFTFSHPTAGRSPAEIAAIDNSRLAQLQFDVPLGGELHGFVGYFHSTLYTDGVETVHISIEPRTESVGMFSWFPIYIPLRTPVQVAAGGRVEAVFWRHVSKQKVWYEWALTQPHQSPIHNPNGRSYHIGL